ncbi:MAG TPA: AAA family ATPase [Candidatus Eisenbacteria bacterium]|nr:AAA family ATPase [Candidatus Eisenbacteria bacterium]
MPPRRTRPDAGSVVRLLSPYNPWWGNELFPAPATPSFRRPVFERIYDDIKHLKQIVSITGPRRVGKTTIVRQAIEQLLREGTDPRRILYFSMDDPLLLREPYRERLFDILVSVMGASARAHEEPRYVFLDEIQRFDGWELYLKKYYDLAYPLRFVISGSATSPIYKKSRESLLGRVKDYHILPFSFREYVLYQRRDDRNMLDLLEAMARGGRALRDDLVTGRAGFSIEARLTPPREALDLDLRRLLDEYLVEGGFPEVW